MSLTVEGEHVKSISYILSFNSALKPTSLPLLDTHLLGQLHHFPFSDVQPATTLNEPLVLA